jgi:hypothetical protein
MANKHWRCALELDQNRERVAGSESDLCDAIRRGADLRTNTPFRHNEHIDPSSDCSELIQEFCEFNQTMLVDDRWMAAHVTLRVPGGILDDFGSSRLSMSFFMYNQNGQQAIARPYLDREKGSIMPFAGVTDKDMPRYHVLSDWDGESNAPSRNFIYQFEKYDFFVGEHWEPVYAHDADGRPVDGSLDDLIGAFMEGAAVKVAVAGLCDDLSDGDPPLPHEVFIRCGSCFYYTERKIFFTETHPMVRVRPAIPVEYRSQGWDLGWLQPQTDGLLYRWLGDPYTLKFRNSRSRNAMRWFVRR